MQGLSNQHEVFLISFCDEDPNPDLSALRAICRYVKVVPWRQYNPNSRRARLGLLSLKPRSYIDTFSPEMKECIEQTVADNEFDLVIASQWEMAGYSSYFAGTNSVFEEVELGVFHSKNVRASTRKQRIRNNLTWLKHRYYLSRLLLNFQACTVVSRQERELLEKTVTKFSRIKIIPNCIDLTHYNDYGDITEPDSLIFTGSFKYSPNYDAMVWFLQNIYPIVRRELPKVHLKITGDHAGRELPLANGVTLTGFVQDIRPYIASSWASVVPLLSGGGTRLKILEAMALRTPVITTSKGAEGLDVEHEMNVLIADEPVDFAQCVVRLLKDQELRNHLADNAYQLVREHYEWTGIMPEFLQMIEDIVLTPRNQKNLDSDHM